MLPFVLMNTLHLHIKHGVGVHNRIFFLTPEKIQIAFTISFNFTPRFLEGCIIRQFFKFCQLG